MKNTLKNFLRSVGVLHPARGIKIRPERKIEILLQYQTPLIRTFVETGTEFGQTIDGIKHSFDEVYSIEFDTALYGRAVEKFAGSPNIHLYCGDSAVLISDVLTHIHGPTLFWLDAHGTKEITMENSPIRSELEAILSHPLRHHVLVDDARHFSRSAIRRIKRMAREHGYRCDIAEGLFRITPSGT